MRNVRQLASIPKLFRVDIFFISLTIHILGLALPLALLQIYDRIIPSQSFGTAVLLITGVAIAIILDALLRYGRSRIFIDASAKYESQTIVRLFERLLHADIREIEARGGSRINDAIRSVSKIKDISSGQAAMALYEIPFIFIYIALIAYVAGWLAWIPFGLFLLVLLITLINKHPLEAKLQAVDSTEQTRQEMAWSIGSGLNYFKAMAAESELVRRFSDLNQQFLVANAQLESKTGWLNENSVIVSQLSTILIVIFGALEVINGNLTTGALAAATLLAGRSIAPAMTSLSYLSRVSRAREAQNKVNELMTLSSQQVLNHESGITDIPEKIDVQLASTLLSSNQTVIKQGEIVVIETADRILASKLLADIAGLGQLSGVSIQVDNHQLSDFNADAYRDAVMIVPQMTTLLPGSILNNLTLYDPRYNDKARDLVEILGLAPVINKLRNGILTEVGPSTAEILDQGIYQRIALIRALVREPQVLLLDHAASGIDMDGLKRLAALIDSNKGKTTVIMATRKTELINVATSTINMEKESTDV